MKLYDTQRSGNAWKVRLLASFLALPLERVTLSIDRGDLRSPAFQRLAPLGQVPVLICDDGTAVAESMAVLFLLAQQTPWWPVRPLEQAQVLSWMSFEQERHMKPLAKLRLHRGLRSGPVPSDEQTQHWEGEAHGALSILEQQLASRPVAGWVATYGMPSIADIALYPYTRMATLGGIALDAYPAIQHWLSRFEALAGYQALFPGVAGSHLFTHETQKEPQ